MEDLLTKEIENKHLPFAKNIELLRYARVLVACGLGNGKGVQAGETVFVRHNQHGIGFMPFIERAVIERGGHVIYDLDYEYTTPYDPDTQVVMFGNAEQRAFFPEEYYEALYDSISHVIKIKSEAHVETHPLEGTGKYRERHLANQKRANMHKSERVQGNVTDVLAYLPTTEIAELSDIKVEEFWQEIKHACFLDTEDPVKEMQHTIEEVHAKRDALNELDLRQLHIKGEGTDLLIELHPRSTWVGYSGSNIPSYELFTTPMASKTEGHITFAYPFLWEGHWIEGLSVTFKAGKVIDWSAKVGADGFKALLDSDEGSNRLGEIALTDKRLSRIEKIIPSATLFTENIGGTGHVAFGSGYAKCFIAGTDVNDVDRNRSEEHKDAVFADFTVFATTASGEEKEIYKDGEFTF